MYSVGIKNEQPEAELPSDSYFVMVIPLKHTVVSDEVLSETNEDSLLEISCSDLSYSKEVSTSVQDAHLQNTSTHSEPKPPCPEKDSFEDETGIRFPQINSDSEKPSVIASLKSAKLMFSLNAGIRKSCSKFKRGKFTSERIEEARPEEETEQSVSNIISLG